MDKRRLKLDGKIIRDPIYCYIPLRKIEEEIIGLAIFQRLRYTGQLSFANLVYPGACHSRFEHSLGVMHACNKFAEILTSSDYEIRLLRWVGLLHDLGHFPFSHAFEPAFYDFYLKDGFGWNDAHVRYACNKLIPESNKIKKILRADVGREGYDEILRLIQGKSKNRLLQSAIKGLFCCDRLDYLQRDAFHAGTPEYSIIDSERIFRARHKKTQADEIFYPKARFALEGAILSYYYMYQAIYYHHTVRSAFSLFVDIICRVFETDELRRYINKKLDRLENFETFYEADLISTLLEHRATSPDIQRILKRSLPKVILGENDIQEYPLLKDKLDDRIKLLSRKRELEKEIRRQIKKTVFLDSPVLIPYPIPFKPGFREPHLLIQEGNPPKTQPLSQVSTHLTQLWQAAGSITRIFMIDPPKTDRLLKMKKEIMEIIEEFLKEE